MQPSSAFVRGAASGRSLYWRLAWGPATLIIPFLIPVLVWSQRGGRNNRWRNTDAFSSGANILSAGGATPWSEMRPASKEPGYTNQRSTQQLDTMQLLSYPPSAAHSTSSPYGARQTPYTVATSPAFTSTPVLPTRPTTAGANRYSSRGSATSSGTTSGAFVAPQPSNGALYDSAIPVNRVNAVPALQRNSAASLPLARSFLASQTPLSESSSTPLTDSTGNTQRVYTAYTHPTASPRGADGRSASDLQLPTSILSPPGRAGTPSTSPPMPFNSGNSSGTSTVSAVNSSFHGSSATSIITPWSSATQQHGGMSLGTVPGAVAGRSTTSAFQPNFSDRSISERQRTDAQPHNTSSPAHQRPWMIGSSSSTLGSENARSSNSDGMRTEGRGPASTPATYAVHSDFASPHTGGSEPSLVISSRIGANTEARNPTTPTNQLTASVDDRRGGRYVAETASWGLTRNVTTSASVEGETASSVWSPRESTINYGDNTTLPVWGNSGSFHPVPLPQWSAISNALSPSVLHGENNGGPPDGRLTDNLQQAYGDTPSRPSGYRNEGSPIFVVSDSSRGNNGPAHPCTQLQGERNAQPRTDNSFEDTCAVLDGPHTLQESADPDSVLFLTQQLSSVSEQSGADLPHGEVPAGISEAGSSHYSANSDRSVDTSAFTSKVEDLASRATHRNESESANLGDETNLTPLVRQHPHDTEGTVDGAVRQDTPEMVLSNRAPLATNKNVIEQRTGDTATQNHEDSSDDRSTEGAHSRHALAGYIPAEALDCSSADAGDNDLKSSGEQPLYGDLRDYMVDAEDPFLKSLSSLAKGEDTVGLFSVTTTSTVTTQTYPPFYNPYTDNLDVDDIPDSPYHNYKWAVDPFPSTYSTHSRLENYESEFNNRYYHEERTAPNITWEEYTRRRKEVDDARKREAELQNEGSVGLIESSDSLFQGLIGYPNRGRMSRLPV